MEHRRAWEDHYDFIGRESTGVKPIALLPCTGGPEKFFPSHSPPSWEAIPQGVPAEKSTQAAGRGRPFPLPCFPLELVAVNVVKFQLTAGMKFPRSFPVKINQTLQSDLYGWGNFPWGAGGRKRNITAGNNAEQIEILLISLYSCASLPLVICAL